MRRAGLAVVGVLYLGAAALILSEHLRTEDDHATPAQIAGSLVLVLLLAGFAFTRGRRAAARDDRPVPRPRWLLALGVIVGAILDLVPSTWAGFAGGRGGAVRRLDRRGAFRPLAAVDRAARGGALHRGVRRSRGNRLPSHTAR